MVLATGFENHRAFDLYRLPCCSVVDLLPAWPEDSYARAVLAGWWSPAIFAVLDRYQIPEHHFNLYVFFATTGIDIGYLLVFLFVGCIAAIAAKEREMAAATTLSLIFAAMTGAAVVSWVVAGHYWVLWRLTWDFADSFAILIGGAIVRSAVAPAQHADATVKQSAEHLKGKDSLKENGAVAGCR